MKKIGFFLLLSLMIYTSSAQFKVATNGKIGVGTSAPQYKFDLNIGESNAFRIYTWTSSYMDNSGDCGGLCFYPQMGYYLQFGKNGKEVGQIWACEIHNLWSLEYSDIRLKENIRQINDPLKRLQRINGIVYNMKASKFNNYPADKIEKYTRDEYGFIAQELQEVFPEVVATDDDGILSVKYTRLIPILVEAIKEQQHIIDSLKLMVAEKQALMQERLDELQTTINRQGDLQNGNTFPYGDGKESAFPNMRVSQNSPNPFTGSTTISCYIPENVQNAKLCIYDMRGAQQKCIAISERGNVIVNVFSGDLSSGIYAYLLKGDGFTSDAKQMIITH